MSRLPYLLALSVSLIIGHFSNAATLGGGLPGVIEDFRMNVCSKKQSVCFQIQAAQAEGTDLKRLFSLENVQVTVDDQKGNHKSAELWNRGYVDLELSRLVVWNKVGNVRTEKVFELK